MTQVGSLNFVCFPRSDDLRDFYSCFLAGCYVQLVPFQTERHHFVLWKCQKVVHMTRVLGVLRLYENDCRQRKALPIVIIFSGVLNWDAIRSKHFCQCPAPALCSGVCVLFCASLFATTQRARAMTGPCTRPSWCELCRAAYDRVLKT